MLVFSPCVTKLHANVLCEIPFPQPFQHQFILINGTGRWPRDNAYSECPRGHHTHQFLACDTKSSCWYDSQSSYCKLSQPPPRSPIFTCNTQSEGVPYTLVCDHRPDCIDGSDEDFCSFPACDSGQFSCDTKRCISSTKVCDNWRDCFHGEDENACPEFDQPNDIISPPALVSLSSDGYLRLLHLNSTSSTEQENESVCPNTHFQCHGNGYCLPVILRCNGLYDCPDHEDEGNCDRCPGFYRCRASQVCLLYRDLCDGHAHCPQHDDELLCEFTCPPPCICQGLAFFCRNNFTISQHPTLRFLDASGSGMTPAQLTDNNLLIHVTLANCGLSHLDGLSLPNLLSLNVQDNHLRLLSHAHLVGVPQLRKLCVAGNPLRMAFGEGKRRLPFSAVISLDLSRVILQNLNVTALSGFPNLHTLNLSHSEVNRVQGEGFRFMEQLRVIDFRGCPLGWFPRGMFKGLDKLQTVYTDNFKVCCPKVLPVNFNLHGCSAPSNVMSSCDDLLRVDAFRVCIFVLSFIATFGNTVSFIFRTYVSKRQRKLGYGTFVTHLSVSDFLMGVYLAVIGISDQVYRGRYLWNDLAWRHSGTCKFAGFLSLLSSEVSALIMCLITTDRFIVLRFPFSQLHFSPKSAHIALFTVWVMCVVLVSVPLLPVGSHWEVYSQTGICIPLPTKRADFAGYDYTFGILIIFNCVVFVVISMGQLGIYWSIRANSMSVSNTSKKTKDLAIARRLISVAMTDFLCWFPVGVLGLMSFNDIPIPGEINVAIAVFVLPLNSAVNPCLYTLNVILERRNRAREEKLRSLLLMQLKSNPVKIERNPE